MNTHGNARARQTQENLHTALVSLLADGKKLSDISVRELCEKASLHKSTFYAHFSSVIIFAEQILTELFANLNEPISSAMKFASRSAFEKQLSSHIMQILNIVQKNQILCSAYLNDPITRERYAAHLEHVDEHLIKNKKYDTETFSQTEIRYEFASRHAAFYTIVHTWLKGGCTDSTETVARIIVRKLGN